MGKTWVKLYVGDTLDNPAMAGLSWEHRGMLAALLALAGKLDVRDESGAETGQLDTLANVAWYLRCGGEQLEAALTEMEKHGIVHRQDGILFLSDYAARQARPPSARRDAVAERVQKHRAAQRNEAVTSGQRAETRPESEAEAQTDADADPSAAAPAAAADGQGRAECASCHEEALGWLGDFGVDDQTARDLLKAQGARKVLFWCAHVQERADDLRNPAGLLVDRLRQGLGPPLPPPDDGLWAMVCCEPCGRHGAIDRPAPARGSPIPDEWRERIEAAKAKMIAEGRLPP